VARAAEETSIAAPLPDARGSTWLVLPSHGVFAQQVAATLTQAGAQVVHELSAADAALQGIVDVSAVDLSSNSATELAAIEETCLSIAQLLRALAERSGPASPRLFLVTRGARAVAEDECPAFAQAPLWGLARSLMIEQPALRCTLIDLDPTATPEPRDAQRLAVELLSPDETPLEQAIALRGEERLVERLARIPWADPPRQLRREEDPGAFRLEVVRPGSLAGLAIVEAPRPAPADEEVEIEVHAAALNFRDVMLALDILPSRESPPLLGIECSGRITALGAKVVGFQAGDEVMAITNGTFGRYVLARAATLLRKPRQMSHAEAATLPSSFATAIHALFHLGRLRAGERVLIHGAAGALGLAAVQLALRSGAQVFATAGTHEKRELLRALGATLVASSRTLDFAAEIRRATAGEGVDLVLNSLSGEALTKSLEVLKPLGRFLEVGKRDFFANSRFGWRLLQQRSYHAIDLDKVVASAPQLLKEIIDDLQRRIDDQELRPLPHRVVPLSRAVEAFATMQRSRHVGKLVIDTREPRLRVQATTGTTAIRRDGTYLISGGLGGLGLAMAEWLAREGAGRIVLIGRRDPSAESRAIIRQLEQAGAAVRVVSADIADPAALARILEDVRGQGPPLRGVIHAAMVLDDALLLQLGRERIDKVMRPKAHAALLLHEQTKYDPLDFFVCCSSLAGVLGNAGQAIYGAANTFLDALCEHRRALGLPALSVSFGAISDVGFVARTRGLAAVLETRGMLSCKVSEALRMLGRLLRTRRAHVGLFRYDWSRYPSNQAALVCNLIERRDEGAAQTSAPAEDLRERLRASSGSDRRQLLHDRLSWHVSRILGLSGKRVDPDTSIAAMGMDSLMAVDLHRIIETSLGADVPVMSLLQGLSIAELAKEIDRKLVASS
jgi:NADPH:quinone reductase-like Zn-dependent oxidoreductase